MATSRLARHAWSRRLSSLSFCVLGVPGLVPTCSEPLDETQFAGRREVDGAATARSPAASVTPLPAASATPSPAASPGVVTPDGSQGCGHGRRLTIHFYDVGEGLSSLVDLPDGRHVVVDTGDGPRRAGCGELCAAEARHLIAQLGSDLSQAPIALLWITHQHADHIGGAPEVLDAFATGVYADNGRDAAKPEVRRAHDAAGRRGTAIVVVDPAHRDSPIAGSRDVTFTPVVPPSWPRSCAHDPNECSIGLRIDYCASSVLFTGDAEHEEEALLDTRGQVTLLQVGHHGSDTSTTPGFLSKVRPRYAVISAGKPGEGYNRVFCHPRALVVRRLNRVLGRVPGGAGTRSLEVFDGERCDRATAADWTAVPTSDSLWATERDGDVVLTTTGDGVFHREGS
jgi:competence protein ComEC